MKTCVYWSSDKYNPYNTEITSLQDILNIMKREDTDIIISASSMDGYDLEIEIYDDYRE